ncbi:hypothetical protein V7S43_004940 [Phytophthora oleae]|uniref:Homeobox domain-containing protein n=1 Tax=Phytophthora oleae TaxID=2107226 RepID=A0ABD3FS78_9STRA
MTFPNRINYRLRSREKSQRQSELELKSTDFAISEPFRHAPACPDTEDKPQEPSAMLDHPWLPLTHKLMAIISQPAKLLAALVVDCDGEMSKRELWARATTYQRLELQDLCSSWTTVMDAIDQYELSPTDLMMLKAMLYYWRLWRYICTACVEAVACFEEKLTSPQPPSRLWMSMLEKRSAASISPPLEEKCSDAMSRGMILSGGSGMTKRSRISKKSNEFLIAWFLAHKDNPYPSPDERVEIAERTGLGEQQVRNWFANMRKRHWKPNRSNAKKPRCLVDYMLRMSDD